MAKRSRTDGWNSTGGTGDVRPQLLKFRVTQTGADTTTTTAQAVPVPPIPISETKTQVMEVLKVYITPNNISEVDSNLQIGLTTKNFGTTGYNPSEPSIIAYHTFYSKITTSGQMGIQYPYVFDCSDGAGHGILVATPNVYGCIVSSSTGLTNVADIAILYRLVDIRTIEFLGIVQSQQ